MGPFAELNFATLSNVISLQGMDFINGSEFYFRIILDDQANLFVPYDVTENAMN